MTPRPLPIDALLGDVVAALSSAPAVIVEAEPGAGKTTRVPMALFKAGVASGGEVLVSEPRRLAARLAARHVASEIGEPLGRTVGYSVRFEQVVGPGTRVRYATEGVVLRQLIEEPTLPGSTVLVLDEVHERHLATDLLLALVRRLQKTRRPDLKLVVMSATLESETMARYLGDCPRVWSEGRPFPVAVEHLDQADDRPLERQVASAARRLLRDDPHGDILVFLPGAAEIRRAMKTLEPLAAEHGVSLVALHGDLDIAEQARAVEPGERRKVILSTNVAESSVTIEGVTAVIDSGLARQSGYSPWSGLATLSTGKVSRASAAQRAGRAGRTRPGRVLRLYTRGDLDARPEHDAPEIARSDLSEALLLLGGAGVDDPRALEWFEAPKSTAVQSAYTLLERLGAIDARGLTATGRRMLDFPLPPRLGRIVSEGEGRGVASEVCLAAALLGERDIRLAARSQFDAGRMAVDASGPSDVLELMERFREAEDADFASHRLRAAALDTRAVGSVSKAVRQLRRIARDRAERPPGVEAIDREIMRSLLTGFPDRVARRRRPTDREVVLESGTTAQLSEASVVHEALLCVALDAEQRGRNVIVRLASAIEADWLLELYPDRVTATEELEWNAGNGRVERLQRLAYGSVVLEEERDAAPPSEGASALLARLVVSGAIDLGADALDELRERILLLREHAPEEGLAELDDGAIERAVARACAGRTNRAGLAGIDLAKELVQGLAERQRQALERHAPDSVSLPRGRQLKVHYDRGRPPWVASRLQDFFGQSEGPRICKGRVPLTLHLLAPNQRAVQVTTDLAGFWERHYPSLRRELSRRYPRHAWPENGRTATPPAPRGRK